MYFDVRNILVDFGREETNAIETGLDLSFFNSLVLDETVYIYYTVLDSPRMEQITFHLSYTLNGSYLSFRVKEASFFDMVKEAYVSVPVADYAIQWDVE